MEKIFALCIIMAMTKKQPFSIMYYLSGMRNLLPSLNRMAIRLGCKSKKHLPSADILV